MSNHNHRFLPHAKLGAQSQNQGVQLHPCSHLETLVDNLYHRDNFLVVLAEFFLPDNANFAMAIFLFDLHVTA